MMALEKPGIMDMTWKGWGEGGRETAVSVSITE
jgi:hypothetical protein